MHLKIAIMDSIIEEQEDVVSDPLKHLLSLDWNSSATFTAIENKIEPSKSVKRVRFSDEVEKISYDSSDEKNLDISLACEESSDDRSYDIEMNVDSPTYSNNNKTDILIGEPEFTDFDAAENTIVNELNDNSSVSPSSEINISVLQGEDLFKENMNQNSFLLVDNYENNLLQFVDLKEESSDLNEVTNQVGNLSLENASSDNITSIFLVEPVSDPSDFNIDGIGNSINKDELNPNINEKSSITSNGRTKNKSNNQKQSCKLNSVLTENSCYSSATELNSVVFKAWCDMKNKTKSVETTASTKKNVSNKLSTSNGAFLTWKKSKTEAQKKAKKDKTISKFPSMHQENAKNSKEEIEMAFKAWKKKKDEIMKQKMSEKLNKEQELIVDSLMEKKEKKLEADAAFNAWKLHKSHVTKMEKKKRTWVMHKKREEEEKRFMRDREALIVYHMWLESKSSVNHNTFSPVKAKPPWTPPGK